MPIYEYACGACGYTQDILQGINDEPLSSCPQCKKPDFKKLVSAAGFRLKGNGWYETDFKKSDKKKNLVSSEEGNTSTKKESVKEAVQTPSTNNSKGTE